jgi:3-dehydroquinate dehydratase/shikimate dehydrogenase
MLFLVLNGKTIAQDIELIRQNGSLVDGFELRADFLRPEERPGVITIPGAAGKPVILTYRLPADGGFFTEPEPIRIALYEEAVVQAEVPFAYIDLEEGAGSIHLKQKAGQRGIKVIRSAHFFKGFPDNAQEVFNRLSAVSGEIPKLAVFLRDCADMRRYLELNEKLKDVPRILPAMGEVGIPFRILSGRLGQLLSYCSPNGSAAAPGHLSPQALQETFGFSKISAATKVFGIAGNPVAHSQSPKLHNAAYRELGLDCVYVPFLVDDPESWLHSMRLIGMSGASVTIPHKEKIIPFLSESDEAVKACGSCNTILFSKDGLKGFNTDSPGFYKPLKAFDFPEKTALVIGAGGAARGICHALKLNGFDVVIVNRTEEKARALALEFGFRWAILNEADKSGFKASLVVQTTSCGMEGIAQKDPFPAYRFSGKEIVYDIVYAPEMTEFLIRAQKAGCKIVTGKNMLIGQAELQFELFTGKKVSLKS